MVIASHLTIIHTFVPVSRLQTGRENAVHDLERYFGDFERGFVYTDDNGGEGHRQPLLESLYVNSNSVFADFGHVGAALFH